MFSRWCLQHGVSCWISQWTFMTCLWDRVRYGGYFQLHFSKQLASDSTAKKNRFILMFLIMSSIKNGVAPLLPCMCLFSPMFSMLTIRQMWSACLDQLTAWKDVGFGAKMFLQPRTDSPIVSIVFEVANVQLCWSRRGHSFWSNTPCIHSIFTRAWPCIWREHLGIPA